MGGEAIGPVKVLCLNIGECQGTEAGVWGGGVIGATSYIEATLEVEGMGCLEWELRRRITFGMEIHKKINKEKVKIKV